MWCHTNQRTDARVRRALIEQHAETRRVYDYARARHFPAAAAVATVRVGCAHPVLGNPGLHRGDRLRRLQPARHRGHRAVACGSPAAGLSKAWAARVCGTTGHDDGSLAVPVRPRWRAWRSRLRWRSSGAVCTARRGGPRARCCRSRRCSSCGTRSPSPPTSGPITRTFVTGFELPGSMPIEELLFFVVIPLCGLLTYNAVDAILEWLRRSEPTGAARS